MEVVYRPLRTNFCKQAFPRDVTCCARHVCKGFSLGSKTLAAPDRTTSPLVFVHEVSKSTMRPLALDFCTVTVAVIGWSKVTVFLKFRVCERYFAPGCFSATSAPNMDA